MERADEILAFEALADGVFAVDRDMRIIAFSDGAERITGYARDEVIGKHCYEIFRSAMCEGNCPIKLALKNGQVVSNYYYTVFTKNDDEIPISVSAAPISGKGGEIAGAVETFRNLAEVRELAERLELAYSEVIKERNRFQAVLNSIADGVFTVDMNFHITTFNSSAERITGFKKSDVTGKPCHSVFRSTSCGEGCPLRETLRTGVPVRDREIEITSKDGDRIPISISTALLRDEHGEVIGGVETFRDLSELKKLSEELKGRYSFGNIVGKSERMQKVYELIKSVAPTNATVLIRGETGTGKELVARAIHYSSPRSGRPFVAVSCAALPENLLESELFGHVKGAFTGAVADRKGRFELADGGTLFLDEIGDVSLRVQSKLLRVLETKEFERVGGTETIGVDVRLIAATNRNLEDKIRSGEFREDLYYRLNVVQIELPPLRERREDIPLLVEHFIARFNRETGRSISGVSQKAMDILVDYNWPGNVRQLENAIEHAFIHCHSGLIQPEHLPEEILSQEPIIKGEGTLTSAEKQLIESALRRRNWNRTLAAKDLGISRTTLWRKIKVYDIKPN